MTDKGELRDILIERRHDISTERREEARKKVLEELYPKLEPFSIVLSFASLEEEIDLFLLNQKLAKEGRLSLPYTHDKGLTPYLVTDLRGQLHSDTKWNIREPIQALCKEVKREEIGCVLVPGLGFDPKHHRIGYGEGYYDRFLAGLTCPTFGIGFDEQRLKSLIPTEDHDILLTELFYY